MTGERRAALNELAGQPWAPVWLRRRAEAWLGYHVVHEAALANGGRLRVLARGTERRLRFGDAWEDQSALDLAAPLRPILPYTRVATLGVALPTALQGVLHVGLGGGTLARVVHAAAPDAHQVAVEPFPEVVEAARRWFDLPGSVAITLAGVETFTGAAHAHDLVVLDAFGEDGTPVGQAEQGFARLRRLLRADGWLVVNATLDVRPTIGALHRVFASVAWLKLADTDQYVVFASDAGSLVGVRARARALSDIVGVELERLLDALTWADGSILALSGAP